LREPTGPRGPPAFGNVSVCCDGSTVSNDIQVPKYNSLRQPQLKKRPSNIIVPQNYESVSYFCENSDGEYDDYEFDDDKVDEIDDDVDDDKNGEDIASV
tara:strand:- start:155 stop:451 length:297 start_codon:yes stop_codon:yes gene_type:complete